ncbi:uncharacterized protein V6R79_018501 [Siganus canaliculatus]
MIQRKILVKLRPSFELVSCGILSMTRTGLTGPADMFVQSTQSWICLSLRARPRCREESWICSCGGKVEAERRGNNGRHATEMWDTNTGDILEPRQGMLI